MYTPSLQQQLIESRLDDIRRARHGQPVDHARAATRASAAGREHRARFSVIRPRVTSRLAH